MSECNMHAGFECSYFRCLHFFLNIFGPPSFLGNSHTQPPSPLSPSPPAPTHPPLLHLLPAIHSCTAVFFFLISVFFFLFLLFFFKRCQIKHSTWWFAPATPSPSHVPARQAPLHPCCVCARALTVGRHYCGRGLRVSHCSHCQSGSVTILT